MTRRLVTALGVATLISQVTSNPFPGSEGYEHGQPTKLRPISIRDYETALGLQRREEEDFGTLSLQKQLELIYGSPGGMTGAQPCRVAYLAEMDQTMASISLQTRRSTLQTG